MLPLFILIPLIGLILSLFPQNKQEKLIFGIAITAIGVHLLTALVFTIEVISGGEFPLFHEGLQLYETDNVEFSISLYFDYITIAYGFVASAITFMVTIFSRYYLHREKGYKRFFNNLLFFYLGINVIIFAGNFETLFIGWEIIGVTSFFLIAFYRDRYLPVKNALKVVSLYRLADICLLLGIWICHHHFGKSLTFLELHDISEHHTQLIAEPLFQLIIPGIFLIVALIKSAQLPFSSWLPRAMEGPTTSSAIFYGSLSVHMGLFLMLRTYAFWEDNLTFKIIVITISALTVFAATTIARVQSSVKTQIAYSSIAQIGLMFIEVALGWHMLALVHFACNAFLRTYQLLVSPSVLNYLIHDQFYNFNAPKAATTNSLWDKIKLSIYTLSIKEFNLDRFQYRFLWQPIKKVGNSLSFIQSNVLMYLFFPLYLIGLFFIYNENLIPENILRFLPEVFSLMAIMMVLKAFTERKSSISAWFMIILNQLFLSLSIGFNEQFDFTQVHLYLSGIIVCGIFGYLCLRRLKNDNEDISLDRFHGHSYERPRLTIAFLIAAMGLSGFPITPTFIGEDLLLGHIHEGQLPLTIMTAMSLILDGLAIFRIYSRVFLGQHDKTYHEVAYRSS